MTRTIVVTGALGGIGAATVAALRAGGENVIATDATEGAERVLDVTDPVAWAQLVHGLERIDGLVNAAGVTHRARVGEVALEDWNRVVAVNAAGPLLGMQAVLDRMPAGGSIATCARSRR